MNHWAALGDVIAAEFTEWDLPPAALLDRERAMYGSADPQEIACRVDAFCAVHLGSHIDAYVFYASSQAGVSGVQLADGRRIVVKAHTPTWSPAFLHAVHQPRPTHSPMGRAWNTACTPTPPISRWAADERVSPPTGMLSCADSHGCSRNVHPDNSYGSGASSMKVAGETWKYAANFVMCDRANRRL